MLVEIPPHMAVSEFMGYLKSKIALMIFDKHAFVIIRRFVQAQIVFPEIQRSVQRVIPIVAFHALSSIR